MRLAIPRILNLCFVAAMAVSLAYSGDSGEAGRLLLQAQHSFEEGDWAGAEAAAQKARAVDPQLADAYVLLGLIAGRQQRVADAEGLFRKAARLEPDNYRTLNYLASACLQLGRADEAAGIFGQVLRMAPANQTAHYNLGLIQLTKGRTAEAKRHFDAVRLANARDVPARIGALESDLILKDREAARRVALELDRLLPAGDAARLRAAALLGSYGAYAEVVTLLEKMPANLPEAREASFDMALALFHLGEFNRAAVTLQPSLAQPSNGEALSLLGDIEDARGNADAALAAYRKATEAEPANENFWFSYGSFLLRQDRAADANAVFARGSDHATHSARLRLGQGVALYSAGLYEQAADCLLRLAADEPVVSLTYYVLGELYEAVPSAQDRVARVLGSYLAAEPKDPLAYREYGRILFLRAQSQGESDYGPAKRSLKTALALDPRYAEAYLQLAVIAQSENNPRESVPLLRKALALKPSLSTAHYRLALAYRKLGMTAQAGQEMDQYSREKNDEAAASRRDLLRTLGTSVRTVSPRLP